MLQAVETMFIEELYEPEENLSGREKGVVLIKQSRSSNFYVRVGMQGNLPLLQNPPKEPERA